MFNYGGSSFRYNNNKLLGGVFMGDYNTHRTLFAGPDPAEPNRVLIRKLVQTSDKVWAFEEARITPSETEGAQPTIHTTLHRLGWQDINEELTEMELSTRLQYRSVPNVIGFSLFSRAWSTPGSTAHYSIVENSLSKKSAYRWSEWFRDLQDRRDMAAYLRLRWALN